MMVFCLLTLIIFFLTFVFFFFKQKTAYEMRISDLEFRRVLFRSLPRHRYRSIDFPGNAGHRARSPIPAVEPLQADSFALPTQPRPGCRRRLFRGQRFENRRSHREIPLVRTVPAARYGQPNRLSIRGQPVDRRFGGVNSMASYSSLTTLIEQAKNETETAYRHLQKVANDLHGAQHQLSELHSYRHDYALRLQDATQTGLSASNYHNFRRFIATLDEAILQQNGLVAQIEARLQGGRQQWHARKQRLNSYETLLERDLRKQRARESRNEQRACDEISSNLVRRAALPH